MKLAPEEEERKGRLILPSKRLPPYFLRLLAFSLARFAGKTASH
jgi:hypothetical protein